MQSGERYSRQVRFSPIGLEGQTKISASRIAVIGIGALGSVSADLLARSGTGFLRIVDRDFVEATNLQRQSLFDEADAEQNLPKAVAAAAKLRRINSSVQIESVIDDVNPSNVEELIEDVDLVIDGLDNFETRFVLNDACAKQSRTWIHAAAVGSYGLVMPVVPGTSPCLRCMMGSLPAPGSSPTCDTAGVIAPITHIVASMQVSEAMKMICGASVPSSLHLQTYDAWTQKFQRTKLDGALMKDCVVCSEKRYEYLDGTPLRTVTLCGRNAVQLIPAVKADLNLQELSKTIPGTDGVQVNEFLLKCLAPPYEITLFKDGRAIVRGTEEASLARSVYSKLIGV